MAWSMSRIGVFLFAFVHVGFVEPDRLAACISFSHGYVQQLYEEGKSHTEINIIFEVQLFCAHCIPPLYNKAKAYHHQERQGQHFQRRMLLDEERNAGAEKEHDDHGDDNGRDHDLHVWRRAARSDHAVEGEHRINDHDLDDGLAQRQIPRADRAGFGVLAFQLTMDLTYGFIDEKEATGQHDQAGQVEALASHGEQVFSLLRQKPAEPQQEQAADDDAGDHPGTPCFFLVGLVQPVDDDADEDHIVNAQHNFKDDQHKKTNDAFRAQYMLHNYR